MAILQFIITFLWQETVSSPTPYIIIRETRQLEFLPVVASGTAIAISLISLALTSYNQYFKKPKIRILVSDQMESWFTPDNEWVFNIGVTIFNDGAQYGVISRIVGRITSEYFEKPVPFRWRMFVEHKNVDPEGASFTPFGSFAGWAYTLVIPARQAVAKTVQFITSTPVNLLPGVHTFEFAGFLGDIYVPNATTCLPIELNQDQVERFSEARADRDTRVAKKSVRLRRNSVTDEW